MSIPFSTQLYKPDFDVFAVPITVAPIASQPNAPAYQARGIFSTYDIDVSALDGSLISEQRTILDIREAEFIGLGIPLPVQLDHVTIPADCNGVNLGEFEILSTSTNGGGMSTLQLRKWVPSLP
jgi:hypothetical protein